MQSFRSSASPNPASRGQTRAPSRSPSENQLCHSHPQPHHRTRAGPEPARPEFLSTQHCHSLLQPKQKHPLPLDTSENSSPSPAPTQTPHQKSVASQPLIEITNHA